MLTPAGTASSLKKVPRNVLLRGRKKSEQYNRQASSTEVANSLSDAERQERRQIETADAVEKEAALLDDRRGGNQQTVLAREGRVDGEILLIGRGKGTDRKFIGRLCSRTRFARSPSGAAARVVLLVLLSPARLKLGSATGAGFLSPKPPLVIANEPNVGTSVLSVLPIWTFGTELLWSITQNFR